MEFCRDSAYRLALTNNIAPIARHTGFPLSFAFTTDFGLISHHDVLEYFELTPRACRRHNRDQEVKQCLDWHSWATIASVQDEDKGAKKRT